MNNLVTMPDSVIDKTSAKLCVLSSFSSLINSQLKQSKDELTRQFRHAITEMRFCAKDYSQKQQAVLHDTNTLSLIANVATPRKQLNKTLLIDRLVHEHGIPHDTAISLLESCSVDCMPALTWQVIAKNPMSLPDLPLSDF